MHEKDPLQAERRKYLRLDTVFPVQLRLINPDTGVACSEWLQGFSNNISKGGICIEINNLSADAIQMILGKKVRLLLKIELPLKKEQIAAEAKIAWVKEPQPGSDKYLIGVSYEKIDPRQNKIIMHYARMKKILFPVAVALAIILGIGFLLNSYISLKLIKGNKALVEQLVKIVQDSSVAKQKIKEIARHRQELQLEIQALQSRLGTLEQEKVDLSDYRVKEKINTGVKLKELNILIEKLGLEKSSLQDKLITLQRSEGVITEDLLHLDKMKATLEKANLDKMYQWLKIHQNPHTGLVASFEGDSNIKDWAFIYDQSLVLQAYAYFSDFGRARTIIQFFAQNAQRVNNLFVNAYYAQDGSPAEYTVHCGPNIWLGIGILQYTKKSQDPTYLYLAEEIARNIMLLQDAEGGLRGGPTTTWYATEHNLDAYAFFNMLYQMTAREDYRIARDKVLAWIVKNTYGRTDVPVKRGKGDSTIATDTYAWSIAAIGPEILDSQGMNPDRIMEFAEKNCMAEVEFKRPEGTCLRVKGFDFAAERNLARGGVVSSEWTAQMVLSFKIMADYYYKKGLKAKGHAYEMKADEYMVCLGQMMISSPSPSGQGESCLPYATQECVDTGHGWMTPKGGSTGSVSGTAYTIFAYYGYNPLELKE